MRSTIDKRLAPRERLRRACLVAMLFLGLLACAIDRSGKVDVQEWLAARGPVVPHDTFPADCRLCHEGESWNQIRADFRFDHAAETGYALEGAHASAECLRCHNDRGPVQVFAGRGCQGCHEDIHRGQLGDDCASCHRMLDWRPEGQIAMHARTRFPLVGAHAATACFRCHENAEAGNLTRTPIECSACHQDDLATAVNPDHQAQGWLDDCQRCHIPTTWTGAGFNHASFPLTGQHASAACSACHAGGVYAGTPDQCIACHLADYQAAPDHVAQGYPQDCQLCHSTSSWQGASFNHQGITATCVTCHLSDYQATTSPNHTAAGFPLTCQTCHSTQQWEPASFNHSFPINGGDHGGLDCNQCHLVPNNFQSFSCTHCHAHEQREMDDKHRGVAGYVWESGACYSCHPNGQEGAPAPRAPRNPGRHPPPAPGKPRPKDPRRP